ncbi:hypothetical protein ThvES_00000660 [Thiovulum sp. ES]|nr:hypothetical protein ThvES_00000660 [Thiovulum sp. ES]
MVFYDSNYNFLKVEESLFKTLKFDSVNTMRSEIGNDFSNLFYKSKFHIHKFENICWLEFLLQNSGKAILQFGDGNLYKTDLNAKKLEKNFVVQIGETLEFIEISKIDKNEFEKFFQIFKNSENEILENLNKNDFRKVQQKIFALKRYFVFFDVLELKNYIYKIVDELEKESPNFREITFWWLDFSEIAEDTNQSFKSL